MYKILYIGPEPQLTVVQHCLKGFEIIYTTEEAIVDMNIEQVDAILDAYMKISFHEDRLVRALKLKIIVTATTGANHIAGHFLEKKGIPLWTLKGQEHITKDITAAAEHSWLLLLAVSRQLKGAVQEVLDGNWERNKFPGWMLRGRTIGIVGCGRIGGWMSRYAEAFGMKILGYDPFKPILLAPFVSVSFEELLSSSDVISIHVPLSEQTTNLFNAKAFSLIKKGAILINTSRGEVVDEAAMLLALKDGTLNGAGVDVLQGEPNTAHHPLVEYARQHDNLIITPHIGGFSPDALDTILEFSCSRIKSYLDGKN